MHTTIPTTSKLMKTAKLTVMLVLIGVLATTASATKLPLKAGTTPVTKEMADAVNAPGNWCSESYHQCTKWIRAYRAGDWNAYCKVRVYCTTCRWTCGVVWRFKYSERCRTRVRKFNFGKCCKFDEPKC